MQGLTTLRRQLERYRPYERVVRALVVIAACLYGADWFIDAVTPHYDPKDWFIWTVLKMWGIGALFAAACAGAGRVALRIAGFRTMAWRERQIMGFAVGALVFFLLMFLGGLLGLYGTAFAIVLPAGLAIGGIGTSRPALKRSIRHLRAFSRKPRPPAPWWSAPAGALGVIGLVLVYLPILSPNNVAFDSHFYHLGIAQQYATEGGIYATPEGWTPAALPHLGSVLYTWTFIFPGLSIAERMLAAAHVEFVMFVFTLTSLPVLVRWLVPGAGRRAWVAIFLFPGLFVYDSSLSVAADHINAAWGIPIYLALRRAVASWAPRDAGLLAAMLAGAALTKYQAMYLLAFPLGAFVAMGLWSLVDGYYAKKKVGLRRAAVRLLKASGAAAVVGIVLTMPHWAKNWVFYGDPLFPYLHKVFDASDQWGPNYGALFDDWGYWQLKDWKPQGPKPERLELTWEAVKHFSVEPHDWPRHHGQWPIFGSLFSLCALPLLALKGAKRTIALALAAHIGVAIWFYTMHQDRYLQTLVPWMAATVAATAALVWRGHWLAKPVFAGLIALQLVWGSDAPLISGHAMSKGRPIEVAFDVLNAGYRKKLDGRLNVSSSLFPVEDVLPADAKVLVHENNPRLGLWRPVVVDIAGWQYGLRYDLYESSEQLHKLLAEMGVTHIVTRPDKSRALDSVGADIGFFHYLHHHAQRAQPVGGWGVYTLAPQAPADPWGPVLYTGCDRQYEQGLHPLTALNVRTVQVKKRPPQVKAQQPLKGAALGTLLGQAQFAVQSNKCAPRLTKAQLQGFVKIASRSDEVIWSRPTAP